MLFFSPPGKCWALLFDNNLRFMAMCRSLSQFHPFMQVVMTPQVTPPYFYPSNTLKICYRHLQFVFVVHPVRMFSIRCLSSLCSSAVELARQSLDPIIRAQVFSPRLMEVRTSPFLCFITALAWFTWVSAELVS